MFSAKEQMTSITKAQPDCIFDDILNRTAEAEQ
jgi:hypothetical protein